MKVVILAGGFGSRLSEETTLRPKPMVEVGGKPILWHIMNSYSTHGFNEFIIALGYKQEVVKDYFLNFYAFNNDISSNLTTGKTVFHNGNNLNGKSISWIPVFILRPGAPRLQKGLRRTSRLC
jgi:glucose-1-phosphate cytidylyltransferase